jgi:hypothetical protein
MSIFDDDVFPFHVPKLVQTLPECLDASCGSGSGDGTEKPDSRDFLRLLRVGEMDGSES